VRFEENSGEQQEGKSSMGAELRESFTLKNQGRNDIKDDTKIIRIITQFEFVRIVFAGKVYYCRLH
jgi:hypothetical protein